ncbi:MAG: TetR/AcrR family transcriptional regulator [Cytophagales bacterium]|nr:MAG: TetR/AcrR family transcriptional regulator [Cytophagales bacterium]
MKENNTEELIKEAAIKVFMAKGLTGARMQEIANEAGINRPMLHYYFRSKEKLYEVVFSDALHEIKARMENLSQAEMPILEKIRLFIEGYMESAIARPEFDMFFMTEFHNNKGQMSEIIMQKKTGNSIKLFLIEIEKAVQKGEIVGEPKQIFLNLLSMLIFPVAGKSMLEVMLDYSEQDFMELMKIRASQIYTFFERAVKP